ncbi:adenosylmethionine--8-amino-7-oxononanoate transaminase [Limisalsivibrio acetivorans]|uniref:adenosylmethionine--8-amino-7-oxononanoate transaminase n=1 Tax=Limisalsivibrio acetivorans TaxID=1304888 RepID=UPI0003B57E2E|nr:adenosylmethionine--8-amino-7-oxononanoate transaminase [Limisalsivibrio acetivorans]
MKSPTNIWHPCTQMKDVEKHPLLEIERGRGIYLYDKNGKSYIDAVSSWWVNLFGHANPRLNEALSRQAQKLEHVIFAGTTHPAAEELTERLLRITPEGLTKVFFADNGSSAVESAMKMSYGYRFNTGEREKNRFAYITNGYHGETLGALSVCDEELYTTLYGPIMMDNLCVPGPDCTRCPYNKERHTCSAECFERSEKALRENAERLTAILVEPLLQCAGGFRMYPPVYLQKLRTLTKELNIHLIFDEIAAGFGRTGTMFALEQPGVTPDLLCLSKGITSGYMPLSVVMATDEIYYSFYDDYETLKAFMHSHSYTGNPLACALAVETLKIFEDENVIENNKDKYGHMRNLIEEAFKGHPNVGEIRHVGFVSAVELVQDRDKMIPFDWKDRTGFQIYRQAVKRGALLRNIGDTMYFMPPYVINKEQITTLVGIAEESLKEVLG